MVPGQKLRFVSEHELRFVFEHELKFGPEHELIRAHMMGGLLSDTGCGAQWTVSKQVGHRGSRTTDTGA